MILNVKYVKSFISNMKISTTISESGSGLITEVAHRILDRNGWKLSNSWAHGRTWLYTAAAFSPFPVNNLVTQQSIEIKFVPIVDCLNGHPAQNRNLTKPPLVISLRLWLLYFLWSCIVTHTTNGTHCSWESGRTAEHFLGSGDMKVEVFYS